jgi:hypothetical protein
VRQKTTGRIDLLQLVTKLQGEGILLLKDSAPDLLAQFAPLPHHGATLAVEGIVLAKGGAHGQKRHRATSEGQSKCHCERAFFFHLKLPASNS